MSLATILTLQSCLVIYVPRDEGSTSSGIFKSKTVKGSQNLVDTKIAVLDYSKIRFSVPGKVIYRQTPDKTPYLQITTDENIFPLLEIETVDNYLKIKCKNHTNIRPSQLTVHTNSPYLNKIEVAGSGEIYLKEKVKIHDLDIRISGSGKVVSDDLSCEKTRLTVTGSGSVRLNGTGGDVSCEITGSGNIDASGYTAGNADCRVNGSGNMVVSSEEKLTASITGSGSIRYKGNPQTVNRQITGSGSIKQIK